MKLNILLVALFAFTFTATAQKYTNTKTQKTTKEWNGLTFSSEKSMFQNLESSSEFSKAAPLFKDGVIEDDAMLTAFVMIDKSFSNLEEDKQKKLFGDTWKSFITYHFIPGRVDANSLEKAIAKGNGTAYFTTVLGQRLGAKRVGSDIVLFDGSGNTAKVIATDFRHRNGFFHIIDGLLLPSTEQ